MLESAIAKSVSRGAATGMGPPRSTTWPLHTEQGRLHSHEEGGRMVSVPPSSMTQPAGHQ
jgi:hypothetical protein